MLRREGLGHFEKNHLDADALKAVEEAEIHDPKVLPHHYGLCDMERLFSSILAPPRDDIGEREVDGLDPALRDPIEI